MIGYTHFQHAQPISVRPHMTLSLLPHFFALIASISFPSSHSSRSLFGFHITLLFSCATEIGSNLRTMSQTRTRLAPAPSAARLSRLIAS